MNLTSSWLAHLVRGKFTNKLAVILPFIWFDHAMTHFSLT